MTIYGIWEESPDGDGWWRGGDGVIFHADHLEVAEAQLATMVRKYQGFRGEVKRSIRRIDKWVFEQQKKTKKGEGIEIVIAGNHQQYLEYLRHSGKSPHEAVYACDEYRIRGRHGAKVVYTGQWWLNPLTDSPYLQMLEQVGA